VTLVDMEVVPITPLWGMKQLHEIDTYDSDEESISSLILDIKPFDL